MNTFYHITFSNNVPSILKHGLNLSKFGTSMGEIITPEHQGIYVTNFKTLKRVLTTNFSTPIDSIAIFELKIDKSKYTILPDEDDVPGNFVILLKSYQKIPKKNIKLIGVFKKADKFDTCQKCKLEVNGTEGLFNIKNKSICSSCLLNTFNFLSTKKDV